MCSCTLKNTVKTLLLLSLITLFGCSKEKNNPSPTGPVYKKSFSNKDLGQLKFSSHNGKPIVNNFRFNGKMIEEDQYTTSFVHYRLNFNSGDNESFYIVSNRYSVENSETEKSDSFLSTSPNMNIKILANDEVIHNEVRSRRVYLLKKNTDYTLLFEDKNGTTKGIFNPKFDLVAWIGNDEDPPQPYINCKDSESKRSVEISLNGVVFEDGEEYVSSKTTCGLKPPIHKISSKIIFLSDQAPDIHFEGFSDDQLNEDTQQYYIGRGSNTNSVDEFELFCVSAPFLAPVSEFKEFSSIGLVQCLETLE